MTEILKLIAALTIISAVAGFALAVTREQTRDRIAQQKHLALQQSLQQVFPEGTTVEEQQGTAPLPQTYWAAKSDTGLIGYAFEVSGQGYAGPIRCMAGVATDGALLGLSILEQSETPGLGDRVKEIASQRTIWSGFSAPPDKIEPWFTRQFSGLSLRDSIRITRGAEWHTRSEEQKEQLRSQNTVTAITGATISTRAVVSALRSRILPWLQALSKQGNA